VVKNQGITAYEPRAVKGQGVSFATNTMGGDHTTGYAVANNILHIGGHNDPHAKEGQVELSRQLQITIAAIDSTGMCLFIAFPLSENPDILSSLIEMISAKLGVELDYSNFEELGIKTLKVEREFNKKAGLTNAHDRLPEFMKYEPLPPHNVVWDFTGEELDALWDFIDNPENT
jgi:aldehyde:ferredoxin oxidoreductase